VNASIERFLLEEKLPDSYADTARTFFDPVANRLAELANRKGPPVMVGLNGAQGSGKTTLSRYLEFRLRAAGFSVLGLSLDDFYYGRAKRLDLGSQIHPLLSTRGVPGTHDLDLMTDTLGALLRGKADVPIPRFDKGVDNQVPPETWNTTEGPVDLVIVEGWCWGARPVNESALEPPVNGLEREKDPDGIWRCYVNTRLSAYQDLYELMDVWLMLKAPSFACVSTWRKEQEEKLRIKLTDADPSARSGLMTDSEVDQFIQFYQRITEQVLITLPQEADLVWVLDSDRLITSVHSRGVFGALAEIWREVPGNAVGGQSV